MKNIFVALALFVAVGMSAQAKKATTKTSTEATTQNLTSDQAAERDMQALTAVITIEESAKANVSKVFTTKYRAKEDTTLSAERLAVLSSYVESQLASYIGDANFAKLKANKKLYNQLVN